MVVLTTFLILKIEVLVVVLTTCLILKNPDTVRGVDHGCVRYGELTERSALLYHIRLFYCIVGNFWKHFILVQQSIVDIVHTYRMLLRLCKHGTVTCSIAS